MSTEEILTIIAAAILVVLAITAVLMYVIAKTIARIEESLDVDLAESEQ